jgi:hypothetical protein
MNAPAQIEVGGLDKLRLPFPPNQVSKLPKPTKAQTEAVKQDFKKGVRCKECGSWHHPEVIHLDYVGHAALTDRLLDADPHWFWEPVAFNDHGLPAFDQTGGLWIKLTVCGVTRLGYGHAAAKPGVDPGAREKEVIGDALRNAAMRFGAALDLWHKGDLHLEQGEENPAGARDGQGRSQDGAVSPDRPQEGRTRPAPLKGPVKTRAEIRTLCGDLVREIHGCADADMLDIVLNHNRELIDQVREEVEFYWKGDGADFLGIEREIAEARARFGDDGWKTNPVRGG